MMNKNVKNFRVNFIKSASNSNNISTDNGYNSDIEKFKNTKPYFDSMKSNEKSMENEISFNISEEDETKGEFNKNSQKNCEKSNLKKLTGKFFNIPFKNIIPLDTKSRDNPQTNNISANQDSDDYDSENNIDEYQKENKNAQREAKELIEKTKRIMNNLENFQQFEDLNRKIKSPSSQLSNTSQLNSTRSINKNQITFNANSVNNLTIKSDGEHDVNSNINMDNFSEATTYNLGNWTNIDISSLNTINYQEEKPLNLSKILKIEKDDLKKIKDENFTSYNNISSANTTSTNLISSNSFHNANSLNIKLLEKIKTCKNQEKEIKEKIDLIGKMQIKIDKQKDEIKKLTEKLNIEKSANVKNELVQLQKKYKEKEEEINMKTKLLDNIFNDYKLKIENLINSNEIGLKKIKELENKLKYSKESETNLKKENKVLEQTNISFEIQIKNLKENFSNELNEKKKLEEKYNKLLGDVKNIFMNLKELSKSKENSLNSKMTEKLKYFFNDKDINFNSSLFLSNCFDLQENNKFSDSKEKDKDTFILSNSNYNNDNSHEGNFMEIK